ncbi:MULTISPECIES: tetratricopeptide repeat protein [Crateriforma]|uniref:Tetratricopeptide repeat protein n=2 Tax=Crateriforma conspicua TaxID=2527996 RepID=A0A5C6FHM0_9PLAN|nr:MULTISPECIES: tetratricopeptide repeat protein [Crateriforma]QDV60897.1 hypothetical protein Mal65_00170 [Crateriforma conspicua]TWU61056.1 hypothetical protein V7x_53680 [Crateriforma conspicua]
MKRTSLRWTHYATCLWPGMADLWWRGHLSGLPVAIVFAIALNWFLVAKFLYPGWLSGGLIHVGFWVAIIVWGFWVQRSLRELPERLVPREVTEKPDRFGEAHAAYLAGDWERAEALLTQTLAIEPRDPPALLMLCGVYRHTGRVESAEILLEEMRRIEVADNWRLELAAEARRLARSAEEPIPAV